MINDRNTATVIPANSLVLGITGRVTTDIFGDAVSWRLGVDGFDDRYGTSYGLTMGSYARGLTGMPLSYYEDTSLLLTGEGGTFSGGAVKFCVHYLSILPPRI